MWTSDLRSYKFNMWYIKPLSLRESVTAAIRNESKTPHKAVYQQFFCIHWLLSFQENPFCSVSCLAKRPSVQLSQIQPTDYQIKTINFKLIFAHLFFLGSMEIHHSPKFPSIIDHLEYLQSIFLLICINLAQSFIQNRQQINSS